MEDCCGKKGCEIDQLRDSHSRVLKAVLFINLVMFFVEFTFGVLSKSTSLKADSLDMLGDATVYAFSLYVVAKSNLMKAKAAFLKGAMMLIFGAGVLGDAVLKVFSNVVPVSQTMGLIGAIALLANALCLFLLTRHKSDDVNMRSVWICSRNDIVANVSVLIAAFLVGVLHSKWPDILVGSGIAVLFLSSGFIVLKEAIIEMKPKSVSSNS